MPPTASSAPGNDSESDQDKVVAELAPGRTVEDVEKEWMKKVDEEVKKRVESERWAEELVKELDKEKKVRFCYSYYVVRLGADSSSLFSLADSCQDGGGTESPRCLRQQIRLIMDGHPTKYRRVTITETQTFPALSRDTFDPGRTPADSPVIPIPLHHVQQRRCFTAAYGP